jgi:hypothetical protein
MKSSSADGHAKHFRHLKREKVQNCVESPDRESAHIVERTTVHFMRRCRVDSDAAREVSIIIRLTRSCTRDTLGGPRCHCRDASRGTEKLHPLWQTATVYCHQQWSSTTTASSISRLLPSTPIEIADILPEAFPAAIVHIDPTSSAAIPPPSCSSLTSDSTCPIHLYRTKSTVEETIVEECPVSDGDLAGACTRHSCVYRYLAPEVRAHSAHTTRLDVLDKMVLEGRDILPTYCTEPCVYRLAESWRLLSGSSEKAGGHLDRWQGSCRRRDIGAGSGQDRARYQPEERAVATRVLPSSDGRGQSG